jgi:hypothetical protein
MLLRKVTREELMDLTGIGAYDEQSPSFRATRVTFNYWPSAGKQAHTPTPSCWCGPVLIDEDEDSESYRHREFH